MLCILCYTLYFNKFYFSFSTFIWDSYNQSVIYFITISTKDDIYGEQIYKIT